MCRLFGGGMLKPFSNPAEGGGRSTILDCKGLMVAVGEFDDCAKSSSCGI